MADPAQRPRSSCAAVAQLQADTGQLAHRHQRILGMCSQAKWPGVWAHLQARAFWFARHMKSVQQSSSAWLHPNLSLEMHCMGWLGRHKKGRRWVYVWRTAKLRLSIVGQHDAAFAASASVLCTPRRPPSPVGSSPAGLLACCAGTCCCRSSQHWWRNRRRRP